MSDGLNPPQREAVRTLSGPMLVLAGAGTGKTRVVTHRIAELIRSGTPAERILAVTFTRKAAGEMHQRAMALLQKQQLAGKRKRPAKGPQFKRGRPHISTFHSLCVRILRRHIQQLGYPERFTICDRGDQDSEARAALREIRVGSESLRPGDLLAMISRWKMQSLLPSQAASIAETDREHLAAAAFRRYQGNLKAKGMVDFDDLLSLTEQLFGEFAQVRREEAGRFDHVMIDEYQDTNASQYHIVKGLAMGHRNLCVVGDDDQSIYGWRGAEVQHILKFQKDWPEAKVVRLEDNYRSTGAILSYANRLIAFNSHRHDKLLKAARGDGQRPRVLQMPDETQEAQRIVADIQQHLAQPGVRAQDMAILCRTNEQPRSFETELRRVNLPYVLLGGMSFFDRKEVRDLLAYLKVIDNPRDEPALLRIINTPARGIGNSTVKQLVEAATREGSSVWEVFPNAAATCGFAESTTRAVKTFRTLVEGMQQHAEQLPIDDLVRQVIDQTGYTRQLERQYPDPLELETRTASLEEIVNAAASYQQDAAQPSLREFLDEIALGTRDSTDDKENQLDRNAIALLTLHSAKGLEFPHVYMVGMEEGILPHKRSLETADNTIDEERRLCYVGVTRAQEQLTFSFALTRRKWGKPRETHPSRFLYEMTGQADNAKRTVSEPKTGRRKTESPKQKSNRQTIR